MTKQELRAAVKQRREAIPPAGKKKLDELICRRIASSNAFRNAGTVLLYAPVRGEIDLLPLASLCRRQGKKVGFPLTDPEKKTISFRLLAPGAKLVPGAYGIPEPPPDSEPCVPDKKTLCILPGLTFDRAGNRLGYGGGYYDRFLTDFPGITMGAVYEKLMAREIPAEPHDKKVQILVNERELLHCESGQAGRWDTSKLLSTLRRGAERAGAKLSVWLEPVRKTVNRWLDANPSAKKGTEAPRTAEGEQVSARHGPPVLVLVTFVFLLLSRLIDSQLTRRGSEYISVILLQLLIFVLPAVLYIQLRGEYFPSRIRMRPVRPEYLWLCVCAFVVMVSGSLLLSIMTGGISSLSGNFMLYNTFVARINGSVWETVYVILAYGVLPAFCEELVYRSVLCAEYESAGTGVAIFVSALFFAMLHFSFPLFPNYLLLGMILAGVMYTTRSTLGAMLLHLLYNLFCLFGQPYLSAFYVNAGSGEIFIFCLIVLLLLFAAFGAGEARKIYHQYAQANLGSSYTVSVRFKEYPKRVLRVLLTPTAGLVALVWLIMAIIAVL